MEEKEKADSSNDGNVEKPVGKSATKESDATERDDIKEEEKSNQQKQTTEKTNKKGNKQKKKMMNKNQSKQMNTARMGSRATLVEFGTN